jgi:hypothetical protein
MLISTAETKTLCYQYRAMPACTSVDWKSPSKILVVSHFLNATADKGDKD